MGAERAGHGGGALLQVVPESGPDGRRFLGGVGGQTQIGIDGTVEHERPHVGGKELAVHRSENGPVGHAVVVDPWRAEGQPQLVHVPGRRGGGDRRQERRVGGPARALEVGEDPGGGDGAGHSAAGGGHRRTALQRAACSRPPFVETDQGEIVADDRRYQRGHEREDEDPALTGAAGIEDDHPLAVGDRVLDHRQLDGTPGRVPVLERNGEPTAEVPGRVGARRPGETGGGPRRGRSTGPRGRATGRER